VDSIIIIYAGLAMLGVGLLWQFKGWAVLFALTAASGYGTYVAYDLDGVDKVTTGFGLATIVGALILFFGLKSKVGKSGGRKAGKKAKAGAH
jgi:hypothetical protein